MFTVDSPVTQIAETAVKSASARGVVEPDRVANGRDSKAVQMKMSAVKMSSANRAGDDWIIACSHDLRGSEAWLRRATVCALT